MYTYLQTNPSLESAISSLIMTYLRLFSGTRDRRLLLENLLHAFNHSKTERQKEERQKEERQKEERQKEERKTDRKTDRKTERHKDRKTDR